MGIIMKNKIFVIIAILALAMMFVFGCSSDKGASFSSPPSETRLSPLETVRRLAAENKQFETNPVKSTEFHSEELKAIHDRGYIVFGMAAGDQKPFKYVDPASGELIGLDVEIAYAIANRLGVKAVFNRNAKNFDGVVQLVANKEADIALSKLSLTTQRAELVRFTQPYIVLRQALLVNRLEYAKTHSKVSIGVVNNSSYVNFAIANFPNAEIKKYDNWTETVNALFEGKVMAIYRDEGEILTILATKKDASILMKPLIIDDKRDPIAMAVSADALLLQSWLNIFIDDYTMQNRKELVPARLVERHFGFGN